MRAFAVFMVILSHWFSPNHIVNKYTLNGTLGVTLFYVLSGFLITGILLRSKSRIENGLPVKRAFKVFYIRRFLRIFPVYYLVLFILLIFGIADITKSFWWHFFYCSNFYYWRLGHTGPTFHFWSLSVEEQFYLIWPAIILFAGKQKLPLLFFAGIIIAMAFRFFMTEPGNLMGRFLMPGSLDSFCLGALIMYGKQEKTKWYVFLKKNENISLGISFAVFAFVQVYQYKAASHFFYMTFFFSLSSLVFAIWIDKVADGVESFPLRYIFSNKVVLYLGKISYGIYIIHMFIPYFYGMHLPKITESNLYLINFLRLVVTLTLASLSWYLFEKPILNLKKQFD
ncbi:MAG: acyltransferase [Bacteroidetes bacterium]|nr:acyltransferase [Bacteroidota bacterium]